MSNFFVLSPHATQILTLAGGIFAFISAFLGLGVKANKMRGYD